jgi:hypothetical protein
MLKPCWSEPEKDLMRLLWEQHVYWTRMAIISIANNLADLGPTTERLLRNAADFEIAFKPFYGEGTAHHFGGLIKDHLMIAAQLVKAAKAGDHQKAADFEKSWYANADQIIYFLNQINPNWPVEAMRSLWYEHLALTKSEAVARLSKNYIKDIAIFDQIEQEALIMADDFAMGLMRQFGR